MTTAEKIVKAIGRRAKAIDAMLREFDRHTEAFASESRLEYAEAHMVSARCLEDRICAEWNDLARLRARWKEMRT